MAIVHIAFACSIEGYDFRKRKSASRLGVTVVKGRSLIAALRRLRIRRLYNNGHFEKSLVCSTKELRSPTNRSFAQNIILKSHYNLGQWEELIDFASKHSEVESDILVKKSRAKMYVSSKKAHESPFIHKNENWKPEKPISNWYQEGSKLWFRYPDGWVFWDMPEGFELKNTHQSLLLLSMNILLKPYDIRYETNGCKQRPFGNNIALSYSGGIDSTAAALLLPENTILAYHERSFLSSLNHDLASKVFDIWEQNFNRAVLRIPSNHELIRSSVNLPVGFSTDFAAGVHLILLADFLDLNTISFGTPIDNTWLKKGATFRDFSTSSYWERWRRFFNHAGLILEFPINHISEAGAMKICQKTGFSDAVNSCLRGDGVSGCGSCWKCFNKNGPLGRKVDFDSREIQIYLNRIPMPTAMHALWSIKVQQLEQRVPQWSDQLSESLDWWEMYYPPGLDLIGGSLRNDIERKTKSFLESMQQPYPL